MEPDLCPHLSEALVRLEVAFDPHLPFLPKGADMKRRTGAALASLTVTHVYAFRVSRRDHPQLPAMTFCCSILINPRDTSLWPTSQLYCPNRIAARVSFKAGYRNMSAIAGKVDVGNTGQDARS